MINAPTPVEMDVKLYLNGFPKSGTHILASMAVFMLKKASNEKNWLGNVDKFAFGAPDEDNTRRSIKVISVFAPNVYIKGHMAYDKRIADALQRNKVAKAFIYRDFRDIAVSAAQHAQIDEPGYSFPEKEFYQSLSFDECLKRIIIGDENIKGVMERWETYAPWMEEDWVLKIAYDDYVNHTEEVIGLFLRYVYGKTASYHDMSVELYKEDYDYMVDRLMAVVEKPEISPTYRKGKHIGKWRKHFTNEHKELFKETDENNWLIRLGYAENRDW